MIDQIFRHARVVALLLLAAASAVAQAAVPTLPTPGQAQQSVQQPRAVLTDHGIQLPGLSGGAVHPSPVPPGGTPIPVTRFDFSGNTKVASAALQAQVAGHTGKSLTLAEIYAIATSLTHYYQAQGYPLASVNVPVQRVADGVVKFEVQEGRIGQVRVEGEHYYKSEALRNQLSELASGSVVTTAQLERELLLLNDLPGITARVTIVPGAAAGTSDLVVKIDEDAFSFYTGVDNYGRDELGEVRFSFNTSINGMGRGDVLTLNLTHSAGNLLNYGRLAYGMPIGTDGGRFEVSYFLDDYSIDAFPLLQPGGRSYGWHGGYSFPLVRSRALNRVLAVGYGTTTAETEALGVTTSSSAISLLDIALHTNGVTGDRRSYTWSLGFSGNLRFNDSGISTDDQCCKLGADGSFTLPVGSDWYSRTRGRIVWSPDTLADTEKFSIGGPYSLRGYDSSELRGDTGFDGSFELHRPMKMFGGRGEAILFADLGQVSVRNPAGELVQSDPLGSLGVGFTAFDVYGFECNLQWAIPVGGYKPADGENDGRAFLSIGGSF